MRFKFVFSWGNECTSRNLTILLMNNFLLLKLFYLSFFKKKCILWGTIFFPKLCESLHEVEVLVELFFWLTTSPKEEMLKWNETKDSISPLLAYKALQMFRLVKLGKTRLGPQYRLEACPLPWLQVYLPHIGQDCTENYFVKYEHFREEENRY